MLEEILRQYLPFWYTLFRDKPITAALLLISIIEFSRRQVFGPSKFVPHYPRDYPRTAAFLDHVDNDKKFRALLHNVFKCCVRSVRKLRRPKPREINYSNSDTSSDSLDSMEFRGIDSSAFAERHKYIIQDRAIHYGGLRKFPHSFFEQLHDLRCYSRPDSSPSMKYPMNGGYWLNINSIKQQHDFITPIGYHLSPMLGYLSVLCAHSSASSIDISWKMKMTQAVLRSLDQMDRAGVG